MTWADFWALIAILEGRATQADCGRLTEELSRRSVPDIVGFAERQAEALYRLDQERFGTLPVVDLTARFGSPFLQSADVFLYTRCAVVAAGRDVWESVFFDTDKFVPYTASEYDGESLLYVPGEAYELAVGEKWHHLTRYSYETCSNPDGWPHLRD
ncbi:DUF4240 domain-containing protein [Streptomyces sp. 142MFCol3.1]|uniref:DUF4240 domain-containing protein n=1 Tax=Streptomyces sp. 142MFCol3.1 TaxID=1172179 RepID=UPI00048D31CA|nr:DUF4240 domain-containing protein [Streptomyces sp. 142MFCol3.1]